MLTSKFGQEFAKTLYPSCGCPFQQHALLLFKALLEWHGYCFALALQLMAALAPEKRLEFEAERLRLVQQLLSVAGNSTTVGANAAAGLLKARSMTANTYLNSSRGRNSLEPAVANTTAATPAESSSSAEAGSIGSIASRPGAVSKLPDLISGHYLLDFGCATKGTTKSRKVKLTNMSSQQVMSSQCLHLCR
jgi:hypothetical protein